MAADNGAPARFKQSPARPVDAGSNETNYTRQRPADAASVVPLVRQPDASFAKERCAASLRPSLARERCGRLFSFVSSFVFVTVLKSSMRKSDQGLSP